MNKTIIININGIVFHIEEDAYEILKNYMTDVKRHFSNSADSLEITTDIENRIAEMFNELLLRENKQVIIEQDVNSVIEQMGTVDDFENAGNEADAEQTGYTQPTVGRRLFRDPDDHLVAGVCAGIANYFDINVVWVRLAFALLTTLGGTSLLLYMILWIVVPKAASRADRMAMRGEKQNLKGFKKNFEEEMSSMRQNLSNFGDEARPFVYKVRDFFSDFFHHLGVFFGGAGKLFVKLIGVLILLACFGMAIALVVGLIAFVGFNAGNPDNFFPFRIVRNEFADKVYISAFLTLFIPVLTIMLVVIKGIFNVGSISRSTGTALLAVWICALAVLVYYATKITAGFRESASFTKVEKVSATKNNVYYLQLNDLKYFSHDDSLRLDIKNHFRDMVLTDDDANGFHNEPRSVTLYVIKSDVNRPEMEESFRANGRDYDEALINARNATYTFTQQDTVLKFDHKVRTPNQKTWHNEEVVLTLKVPMNSKVIIDEKLDNYIQDVNLYDCRSLNATDNKASYAIYTMTDKGLECKVDTIVKAKPDSLKKDSAIVKK